MEKHNFIDIFIVLNRDDNLTSFYDKLHENSN